MTSPKHWSVYTSYTDIYQPQELDVDTSGEPIDPIVGSNIEAGIKMDGLDGKLNASLAVYRIEQKNYPHYVGTGPYTSTNGRLPNGWQFCCYDNSSDLTHLSRGVDAEVTGELLPGWQVFAGYTFNMNSFEGKDSRKKEGHPLVTRSPKHLLKVWTSYHFQHGELLSRLNIGAGVIAQSSTYQSGYSCTGFTYGTDANGRPTAECLNYLPYDFTVPGYATVSAQAGYQLDTHWNAALNIGNVLDKIYYQTVGDTSGGNWYGEPRSYTLTLRGTF